MVIKRDSIFAPRSKRNLIITASLAMALGMGAVPGIALAEELPADDTAPTITRVDAASSAEETAIVASVEPAAADTSRTIYRTDDALKAAGDTPSYYSNGSHTSGYSGGYSPSSNNGYGTGFVTEGNNRYSDSSSNWHPSDSSDNWYSRNDYNRHEDSNSWLDGDYPYSPSVQVIGGGYSRDESTQTVTPVSHEAVSLSRGNEGKQSVQQPAQPSKPVSDAEAQTKVASEQLSSFVSDAASASDFASQLGVESVKVVGEPELKQIADGVFEVEKMPKLEVEDAEASKPEGFDYWWCVYIDGAKTKVMDAIGNLAEGIDNLLWSPDGTVDPTSFEGELVFAQDPGMTVVMTASSELGVEAVTEPAQFAETATPSVVTEGGVKDDGATGTDASSTSSNPLPSTGNDEPTVSLGERMAAYIPNQVADTPTVAAAAEAVESLAVTADHTDARPVVAWGIAGVATLIVATMRRRREER